MGRGSLWLVLALAGCAGAEAMTLPHSAKPGAVVATTNEVGLNPGEQMAFEVRLGGVLAGEAALAVGELGEFEGKRAVVVKSRANTAGAAALIKRISDEATTIIDMESGRPLQLETLVEMGQRKTHAQAKFVGNIADVTYTRSDDPKPHNYKINFGTQTVHDTHSAMAQVRGWRPAPGTTRSVFVVGGRRLWRVDVKFLGTETIGSAMGNRRAIKFEGASFRARPNFTIETDKPMRTFTVWLSDDADRVPLRVLASTELGDVTVDLTDYSRP
ncbi:MAG TPA: DUF3108 domain-containing protein [Kofleriaceae bacterium]